MVKTPKKTASRKVPPPKKAKPPPAKHKMKNKKEETTTIATTDSKSPMAWRTKLKLNTLKAPKSTAMVPYTLDSNNKKTKMYWPSAIFWNALYRHGILVSNTTNKEYMATGNDDDESNDGGRSWPCLTSVEARLWGHKHAAHMAVARRFPIEVGRLLGTITLEIKEVSSSKTKRKGKAKTDANALVPETLREVESKLRAKALKAAASTTKDWSYKKKDWNQYVKKISPKQATDEAAAELPGRPRNEIVDRSKEIQDEWKHIGNCEPYKETWDPNDGSCHQIGNEDDQYVMLKALQSWLEKGIKAGTLQDVHENKTRELYNGLTKVPINATTIMSELLSLATPSESIYGVPLVCAYPRMTKCGGGGRGVVVWKVQIGVYMHRLLPEIFTCKSLHVVMSALDENSYKISQQLRLPPSGPEVFESAPYPKVDMSVLLDGGKDGNGNDDDVEVIDVDMEGGDRDELVISPFSVKGLLKLLENKGCDVSSWPQIERELRGRFRLNLLLHQKHAIAWMIQMEHLEGAYGINSLLWEERTFPDGGHFYYSPALGQLRLGAPPPHMKGGLLCDEQGLGKTVEVLGLIMATLSELKKRLDTKKKATAYDGDEYYSAESEDDEYVAHSTLIIVPPALLAQWLHEIEKAVGQNTVTVSTLVAQTGELNQSLPPPATDGSQSEEDEDDWDRILASDIVLTTYDALDKACCQKVLQTVQWGRVVLDEMQEIRSSTTKIAKNCEKLQCDRRWMLSGTPIFQGIEDLRGELNFLRLEPFGASWEDGFFEFAVQTPWEDKNPHAVAMLRILGLIALRRSKDMTIAASGAGLLDLKPMTVEYIPVPQSHSERALYCWMESLVASELQLTKDAKKKKSLGASPTSRADKANLKSQAQCLRLLRELCITPMLLNGGLGTSSQLRAINNLMTRHNQREHITVMHGRNNDGGRRSHNNVPVMSCCQGIKFLSQHQEEARTESDMVTDMLVGGGRGVTNRDRATESPEKRYNDAKEDVANAEKSLTTLTKKCAKARWHLALEYVTTGQYSDGRTHKFSGLWKLRGAVIEAMEQSSAKTKTRKAKNQSFPPMLTRGWRPSSEFLHELYEKKDFSWSHPYALLASNIPKEVYQKELASALRDAAKRVPLAEKELESCSAQLSKLTQSKNQSKSDAKKAKDLEAKLQLISDKMEEFKSYDAKMKLPVVIKVRERKHSHGFWQAIVQFETDEQKEAVLATCGKALGAAIGSKRNVPHIKSLIAASEEAVALAGSENQVHPSLQHKKKLAAKKREAASIKLGLRLVTRTNATSPAMSDEMAEEAGTKHAYVLVSKAVGNQRSLTPRNASALIESATATLEESKVDLPRLKTRIANGKNIMQTLKRAVNGKVSPRIAQLSAYETLEALRNGEVETKTQCVICLGYLGQAEEDADEGTAGSKRKRGEVAITMIKCGHFYCTRCIQMHQTSLPGDGCPACRKPFSLSDTIQIDTSLKDEWEALKKEREAAKSLVREAGKLLTESHGSLDAELWRALWLAFDLPEDVPRVGHQQFSAIPREVFMHLRAATGVPPNMKPSSRPPPGSVKGAGRNSKIQAVLDLLPKKERCVVFSSNKDCLHHLAEIFKDDKIGYQLVATGQTTTQLRDAVSNWESGSAEDPPYPVLLVHAGAASAGLTLTAASKMIITEPFMRQEQEHQAYARCHRYSQKHKVSVKVLYTPVSVESRLLEWRKGGKSASLVSKDKAAEECNFEENTDFIIHDINETDDDDDENSEDGSKSGKDNDGDDGDEESHDIAQANFLLGLVD